jgi:hypothetical protein
MVCTLTPLTRAADAHPDLTRLSPTEEIWVDFAQKKVVVGGRVALSSGPIELFACPIGTKEHESIVALRASARLVQAGLLAIGLEPDHANAQTPGSPLITTEKKGTPLHILVRFQDEHHRWQSCRAEEWIKNTETKAATGERWLFAGTAFAENTETGELVPVGDTANLICVANFPASVITLTGNSPHENSLLLYEAFEGRIPPIGTSVEVILRSTQTSP